MGLILILVLGGLIGVVQGVVQWLVLGVVPKGEILGVVRRVLLWLILCYYKCYMFSTMGGTWVGFGGDTCVLPGNWGSTRGSTWGGISPVDQGVIPDISHFFSTNTF